MFGRIIPIVSVIVAIIMAFLASTLSLERLHTVVLFMRFFETMLPILAVGALLKYLFGVSCSSD